MSKLQAYHCITL